MLWERSVNVWIDICRPTRWVARGLRSSRCSPGLARHAFAYLQQTAHSINGVMPAIVLFSTRALLQWPPPPEQGCEVWLPRGQEAYHNPTAWPNQWSIGFNSEEFRLEFRGVCCRLVGNRFPHACAVVGPRECLVRGCIRRFCVGFATPHGAGLQVPGGGPLPQG